MVPPVQSNFFEWPNCLCHVLAPSSAGLTVLLFLPQLVGRRHLEVLLPSRVSHVCFASLAVVPGLGGGGGELPWAALWCSEEAPAQRAEVPGAGTGCCPPPLEQGGAIVKNNPFLQSKSTYFPAKFSASFLFCFVGNERELNCLNPSGKYLSAALYCKLVFQLF